nr:MAG TPA: UvrABC system protein C [Caudoviricetes sp.]
MRFEDFDFDNCHVLYKRQLLTNYIYFLIKNEEVVYVGQTSKGLCRIYQHLDNKVFDKVYLLKVEDKNDLNKLELFYIFKYKPLYNKSYKVANTMVSLKKVRNYLRDILKDDSLTVVDVRKILKKYDIKIFKNEKISESIYKDDFLKLQLLTERDCKNGSKKSC